MSVSPVKRRVFPERVIQAFHAGETEGRWIAQGMMLDTVNFTGWTRELETRHGVEGLERLVALLQRRLDPLLSSLSRWAGEVIQFTGDGMVVVFPGQTERKGWLWDVRQHLDSQRYHLYEASGEIRWILLRSPIQTLFVPWGPLLNPRLWRPLTLPEAPPDQPAIGRLSTDVSPPIPGGFPWDHAAEQYRWVGVLYLLFDLEPDESPRGIAETLLSVASRYGGWVARLGYGDKGLAGLMLFGAPFAVEGVERRSRLAARTILDRLGRSVRGGFRWGRVFAGWVGTGRSEYTVMGNAVNMAARLAQAANWGDIIEIAPPHEEHATLTLRGFPGVWAVRPLHPPIEAPGKTADGFIGRKQELGLLRESLRNPRWVVIQGPGGVGKTRLVEEALRAHPHLRIARMAREEGMSDSSALIRWLEDQVGVSVATPEFWIRVRRQLFSDDLSAPVPENRALLAPDQLIQLAFRLLQGSVRPDLLVVEDAHALDPLTRTFLTRLQRQKISFPVWILQRDGEGKPLSFGDALTLRLRPFRGHEVRTYLRSRLGGRIPRGLFRWLGNQGTHTPLVLEEVLRHLRQTGALVHEKGAWRFRAPDEALPPRIYELVTAMLDRLDPRLREILLLAATAGVYLRVRWLEKAIQTPVPVNRLVQEGWWEPAGDRIRFRHPLLQETLYALQTRRDRGHRHHMLARTLEEEDVFQAALHLFRAWKNGVGEEEEVRNMLERALSTMRSEENPHGRLELLDALGQLNVDPARRVDIAVEKGSLLRQMGMWEKGVEELRSAALLAHTLGLYEKERRACVDLAWIYMSRREMDKSRAWIEHVARISEDHQDREGQAIVHIYHGIALWREGRAPEAFNALRQAEALIPDLSPERRTYIRALVLNNLGNVLDDLGRHEEAMQCYQDYLELAQRMNDPVRIARAWLNYGGNCVYREDYREAVEAFRKSYRMLRDLAVFQSAEGARMNLAYVLAHLGHGREAYQLTWEAFRKARQRQFLLGMAFSFQILANVFFLAGHPARALRMVQHALRHARKGNLIQKRHDLRMFRAEILMEMGEEAKAEKETRRLLEDPRVQQFKEVRFRAHALLAELAARRGARTRARRHLTVMERLTETPGDGARVLEIRYRISGDPGDRRRAEGAYREAFRRTGKVIYRQRLQKLSGM